MTNKRYKSVTELMDRILKEDDPEFSEDLSLQMSQRQIVRGLATLRNSKNVRQDEIARKMGCAQSRVSKIENGLDDDLRMKDIQTYLKVLGYMADINLLPADMSIVDEIKYYAFRMKIAFEKLTSLARKDDAIQQGVAQFHIEALINLMNLVKSSASQISKSKNPISKIRLTFADEEMLPCKNQANEAGESQPAFSS
jgi:transcriptional regulator with XRE-family HTH domain